MRVTYIKVDIVDIFEGLNDTKRVFFKVLFGFTCSLFVVVVTVTLRRLGPSALDGSPAALKGPAESDTCVAERQRLSPPPTHTPFPRFPGESQTGKSESRPPPHPHPPSAPQLFLSCSLFPLCSLPASIAWGSTKPPIPPSLPFSSLNKSSLR